MEHRRIILVLLLENAKLFRAREKDIHCTRAKNLLLGETAQTNWQGLS